VEETRGGNSSSIGKSFLHHPPPEAGESPLWGADPSPAGGDFKGYSPISCINAQPLSQGTRDDLVA
jgi:hypothetical protein